MIRIRIVQLLLEPPHALIGWAFCSCSRREPWCGPDLDNEVSCVETAHISLILGVALCTLLPSPSKLEPCTTHASALDEIFTPASIPKRPTLLQILYDLI